MRQSPLPFVILLCIFSSLMLSLRTCRHRGYSNSDDCYGYRPHAIEKCEADSFLTIAPELIPYLNAFKADCKRYGVKCDHAYCLNWLGLGHMYGMQGMTSFETDGIEINALLQKDTIGMKFVVYHELGHWFGLGHGDGIMKRAYNTNDDHDWVQENWEELLAEHFEKIKNTQQ